MKKLLFMAAISLVAYSCQQEDLVTIEPSANTNLIRLVNIDEGVISATEANTRSLNADKLALQFNSETTYQSFLNQLKEMTHEERLSYVKSYGLISLQQLAEIADDELEIIGSEANSETEFRELYDLYTKKYEGFLINNQYDTSNLSLYVPEGDDMATYVINEEHKVVIGDKIKTVSLENDMSEADKAVFAIPTVVSSLPGIEPFYTFQNIYADSKKVSGSVNLESNYTIRVHVGTQKKMWYGWKRDNDRDVYFQFSAPSTHMYYLYQMQIGDHKQDVSRPTPFDLYFYPHKGSFDYTIGALHPNIRAIEGTFYVWTDHFVESTNTTYMEVLIDGNPQNKVELPVLNKARAFGGAFTIGR